MILTGENRNTWRGTGPNATFFTTDCTRVVLGANPGLRCELATNSLSYGTANIVLRRMFGSRSMEKQKGGKNYKKKSSMFCTFHQI
jgi:hypothetical protein